MAVQFFQQQLDYIYFFYGLGFILLAAVCVEMRGDVGRRLPWIWLAGFGFAHGIYEWLEMLALGGSDSPAFAAGRLVLMTISFVLLFEFGRDGLRRLTGKSLGGWVYIPLLIGFALAVPQPCWTNCSSESCRPSRTVSRNSPPSFPIPRCLRRRWFSWASSR